MFIFGGEDVTNKELSTTPEMIDLKNIDQGWKDFRTSRQQ